MRRDWALDLLFENFDVREVTEDGRQAFVAFAKSRKVEPRGEKGIETLSEKPKSLPKPLVRFVPPAAGMFLWFQVSTLQPTPIYQQALSGYVVRHGATPGFCHNDRENFASRSAKRT